MFGLGPLTVYDSTPDKYWFKGKPSHMRLHQGKAMLGGIELELVQPLGLSQVERRVGLGCP